MALGRRTLVSTTALLGVAGWMTPATAQESAPAALPASNAPSSTASDTQAESAPPPQDSSQDIIVTGIRESLEQAAKIKQDSLQVVDSVVAEDIGKFPDPTTAAALQRVPGVQVELGSDNEISGVRIRGLNDILTTIDGREVFSTTGRNFDLQDVPATALRRVNVIKTSTADLIEGGIAGIIDLQLNKPFDFHKPTIVATARGDYGLNQKKASPQFSLLATDRWNTGIGEIGALVNLSWRRSNYDYPFLYENIRRSTSAPVFNIPGYASQNVAGGVSQNGSFTRKQANGALQWQASPSLQVYLDGVYTDYRSSNQTDFVEAQLFNPGTKISDIVADDNCFTAVVNPAGQIAGAPALKTAEAQGKSLAQDVCEIDSATYTNPTAFASTQARRNTRSNYLIGGGFKFNRGPGHVTFDAAYQKSTEINNLFVVDVGKRLPEVLVESNTPDGGRYTFTGNPLDDPDGFVFRNGLNQNFQRSKGDLFQARIDARFDVGGLIKQIQYGVRFASRGAAFDQALVNQVAPGGDIGMPGGDKGELISSTDLPGDFLTETPGIPGLNDGAPWLTPNPAYLRSEEGRDDLRTIYGVPIGDPAYQPERHFDAREKTMTGYGQIFYNLDISGPIKIDGAIGARATVTDRRIEGAGLVTQGGDQVAIASAAKTSDFDFLPNASARIRFGGGLQARLVYAKAVRRPSFSDLNPGISYIVNFNQNVQANGSAGNPDLKEQKTDSYDATLEYYFRHGYLAVGGYYRDIANRVVGQGSVETIGGIDYLITRPRNIGSVTLKGIEAGGQAFFDFLPGALSGLGVQANFTYADSKVGGGDPLTGYPLIGVSKYNYNAGLLYEKHRISGRLIYTYRSRYITQDATGLAGLRPDDPDRTSADPIPHFFQYVRPGGRLDFSVGYDLTKAIRLDVGGSNILRNKYRSYFLPGGFNGDTHWDDTTYTVGVRVKL